MSHVVSFSQMQEMSLDDIISEMYDCKGSIWEQAEAYGRDPKIYLHWTAGRYGQFWDSYHLQIDDDGKIYKPEFLALDDAVSGTWRRNSGAVDITMLGCFDATTSSLGTEPPTAEQIDSMAKAITVCANALDLTIDIYHVMTHGEAADNEDGYLGAYGMDEAYGPKNGCERWDLEYLGESESPVYDPWGNQGYMRGGDVLRGKANWFRNQGIQGVCAPR